MTLNVVQYNRHCSINEIILVIFLFKMKKPSAKLVTSRKLY